MTLTASVLMSSARFGANYFLNVLRVVWPQALILGEIFRKGGDTHKVLSQLLSQEVDVVKARASTDAEGLWRDVLQAAPHQLVIAKAFYYHQPHSAAIWPALAQGTKVIHLVRANLFDAYVSRELAVRSRLWSLRIDETVPPQATAPMHINPTAAEAYVRERLADINWCRTTYAGTDFTEITFEEISRSPRRCAETIGRVFGPGAMCLPPGEIKSSTARIKKVSNADLILNYPDVAHLDVPISELVGIVSRAA